MKSDKIFSLKISLSGSSPSIWRRIWVPADYSFFDLHCSIQNAMGWFDSHLHGFSIGQKVIAGTIQFFLKKRWRPIQNKDTPNALPVKMLAPQKTVAA